VPVLESANYAVLVRPARCRRCSSFIMHVEIPEVQTAGDGEMSRSWGGWADEGQAKLNRNSPSHGPCSHGRFVPLTRLADSGPASPYG
jgi:hypothetical protein